MGKNNRREREGNGKRRRLTQLMKKKREGKKQCAEYLFRYLGKKGRTTIFKMSKKEKTVRIRTFPDIILI